MSKQPGFTVKRKTPTSAIVNGQEINLSDFRAYLPVHNYIFMPCREPWPAASIDAVFPPQVLSRCRRQSSDEGRQGAEARGQPLARSQSASTSDDVGARDADAHSRSAGGRRRLVRALRCGLSQSSIAPRVLYSAMRPRPSLGSITSQSYIRPRPKQATSFIG